MTTRHTESMATTGETIHYDIGDVTTKMYSSPDHMQCACMLKSDKRCASKHKFYYLNSNREVRLVCGRINHRAMTIKQMQENGASIVGIFEKVSEISIQNTNDTRVTYKVIATNVSGHNDVACPLVMNNINPVEMREALQNKSNETQSAITNINNEINRLYSSIGMERRMLMKMQRIRYEYENALVYMRSNTEFKPDTSENKSSIAKETCAICFEQCDTNHSITLECSHSFHINCIKPWFGNKPKITCPCCRHECDSDKYFRYKNYRPATTSAR